MKLVMFVFSLIWFALYVHSGLDKHLIISSVFLVGFMVRRTE